MLHESAAALIHVAAITSTGSNTFGMSGCRDGMKFMFPE